MVYFNMVNNHKSCTLSKGALSMLCPHCHQEISAGSKFCNFCGKPIPQEVFCAKCGAKLPQGSRFCHLCGEAVNAVPAPDAEEEKRAGEAAEGAAARRDT